MRRRVGPCCAGMASSQVGGVGFERGPGFVSIERECEVGGGVFEAVEVELDERIFAAPEQCLNEREALWRWMRGAGGGAGEELGLQLAFAPLVGGLRVDDDAAADGHCAAIAVKRKRADGYVEDGLP